MCRGTVLLPSPSWWYTGPPPPSLYHTWHTLPVPHLAYPPWYTSSAVYASLVHLFCRICLPGVITGFIAPWCHNWPYSFPGNLLVYKPPW